MSPCIFCQVVQGELDSEIVQENDRALAFKDVNPQAPTHVLVIPKEPIVSVGEATEDQGGILGHLMLVAQKVARDEGVGDAFRVVANSGAGAGQSVFHLHLHVLGGRPFSWPPG